MSIFTTLPAETLGTVAAHCDISSLQALRLTCSPIEEVFRPYMFQSMKLSLCTSRPNKIWNIQVMKMLAQPGNRISKHVRRLHLDTEQGRINPIRKAPHVKPFAFLKRMTPSGQTAVYQSRIDKYAIPALASLTELRHVQWLVDPFDNVSIHIIPVLQKAEHLDSFVIYLSRFGYDGKVGLDFHKSMEYISSLRSIKSLRLNVTFPYPATSLMPECVDMLLKGLPELRRLEITDFNSWGLIPFVTPPYRQSLVVTPPDHGHIRITSFASSWPINPGDLTLFRDLRSLTLLTPQIIPWEEFTAVSVLLTHIRITSTTRPQLQSMLTYLESYSGLEVLDYKQTMDGETPDMADGERFYMHVLPRHATTLCELQIYCYWLLGTLQTPESFNNLSSYLQLQSISIPSARLTNHMDMEWEVALIRSVHRSLRIVDITHCRPPSVSNTSLDQSSPPSPDSDTSTEEWATRCKCLIATLNRLPPLPHHQVHPALEITIHPGPFSSNELVARYSSNPDDGGDTVVLNAAVELNTSYNGPISLLPKYLLQ